MKVAQRRQDIPCHFSSSSLQGRRNVRDQPATHLKTLHASKRAEKFQPHRRVHLFPVRPIGGSWERLDVETFHSRKRLGDVSADMDQQGNLTVQLVARDLQLESPTGRVGARRTLEILGDHDLVRKADRGVVGRPGFFRATYEPSQPRNSESGLIDEGNVDLSKSRSIKSGDEVLYVLAVTLEFEFGESGEDSAIDR